MPNNRRFLPEELDNLEAVMPVAAKDLSKVPYATDLLLKNTPVNLVHVITDSAVVAGGTDGVVYHHERDVLPYGSDIFGLRQKWVYQQMIKLTQSVTAGKWYVSVDADTFVIRPISLWDGRGPYLFYEVEPKKIVGAYGKFNEKTLGFNNYPFSVLNNVVLFNKSILEDMMKGMGADSPMQFAKIVKSAIGPGCYPAEAQLYLSWLLEMEPGLYGFRSPSVGWRGMYDGYVFNDSQIKGTIDMCRSDILLLHSWETKPPGWTGGVYEPV